MPQFSKNNSNNTGSHAPNLSHFCNRLVSGPLFKTPTLWVSALVHTDPHYHRHRHHHLQPQGINLRQSARQRTSYHRPGCPVPRIACCCEGVSRPSPPLRHSCRGGAAVQHCLHCIQLTRFFHSHQRMINSWLHKMFSPQAWWCIQVITEVW